MSKAVSEIFDAVAKSHNTQLDYIRRLEAVVEAVKTHEQYGEERTWKKVQDALDALEGEV